MDHQEKLAARLELLVVEAEKLAVFAPAADAIERFCVGLSLLWHGLVGRLVFECTERTFLVLSVDETLTPQVGAIGEWNPPTVRLAMSRPALELWLVFALKHHRDGVSDVDHVDLEAKASADGEVSVFITLEMPSARKPLSVEELQAMLK